MNDIAKEWLEKYAELVEKLDYMAVGDKADTLELLVDEAAEIITKLSSQLEHSQKGKA